MVAKDQVNSEHWTGRCNCWRNFGTTEPAQQRVVIVAQKYDISMSTLVSRFETQFFERCGHDLNALQVCL